MSRRRNTFPRCGICGTHGHADQACALFDLNAQQEKAECRRLQDIRLGLTPTLEREILAIRVAWKLDAIRAAARTL